jgi:hypothetical protein
MVAGPAQCPGQWEERMPRSPVEDERLAPGFFRLGFATERRQRDTALRPKNSQLRFGGRNVDRRGKRVGVTVGEIGRTRKRIRVSSRAGSRASAAPKQASAFSKS